MDTKYAYVLPHWIRIKDSLRHAEIFTQKRSFTMKNNELFALVGSMLDFVKKESSVEQLESQFSKKLSQDKIQEILSFLEKQKMVFLSEYPVGVSDMRLITLLGQYTDQIAHYLQKLKHYTFCVLDGDDYSQVLDMLLKNMGLNCRIVTLKQLEDLSSDEFLIAAVNASQLNMLDEVHKRIDKLKSNLWSFIFFYGDSFLISPILNQADYIDYGCVKEQMEHLRTDHVISKNMLVENIGFNELLLEVITSITKLNIKTGYGRAIVFDTVERTIHIEKIYYLPHRKQKETALYLKRWDVER